MSKTTAEESKGKYTPSTDDIKRVYCLAPDNLARDGKPERSAEASAQFDRWLAHYEAELAFRDERIKAAQKILSDGNPWAKKCPSCGSAPGEPCYGNGPMPRRMTHSGRAWSSADAIEALSGGVPDAK